MWLYDYKSPEDNPYSEPPFVAIIHMSYVDNLPTWVYPWHSHKDSYELAFIIEGSGNLVVNSQSLPLRAGSIAIIQPKTLHRFTVPEDGSMSYYTLRFLAEPADGELQSFFGRMGSAVTPGNSHLLLYLRDTFHMLLNIHQTNGGHADQLFQSVCLGLIQLTRTLLTNKAFSVRLDDQHFASDILNYIVENRSRNITLESMAKQFNVSPSHLSRIFSNAYGTSPINYLINARVTYATELLLKSNLSIPEIAEYVGYENTTHFNNMFLKRIGCTPAEYREKNQKLPVN